MTILPRSNKVVPIFPRKERRLAAISFVDVVGYSRLVEVDDEGTIDRWAALRRQIIEPLVAEYRGRTVERLGDGLLLEFQSVVEAVRWALNLQGRVAEPPATSGLIEPLRVRIAVHLGDVVADEDRILGDGVNIAARLQEYAPPGGITISGAVHEQVRHLVQYHAEDMGLLTLKNITRPIRTLCISSHDFGNEHDDRHRWVAILAADVADSNQLVEAGREETQADGMHLMAAVVEPCLTEWAGQAFRQSRNGFLAMFEKAQDAVRCALLIQQSVARMSAAPAAAFVLYRMGINFAHVLIEGRDASGDGVIIAE